ncbi:MAG: NYN domain-containing protein [Acidimicrobiia bacterium]|nr:NYN domain-containing protein [Acidimicrobiia bacterium]
MKASNALANLLEPALEATRRVLRDLEPEEIPAALLKVARASGRRLPPPYARSLVAELDGNDWLRDKATDAMVDADPDSDDSRLAAAGLFLHRPEDWEARLAALLADHEEVEAGSEVAALQQTVARMKAAAEAAKEKERKARTALVDARTQAEKKIKEARAAAEAARSAAAEPSADLAKARQDSAAQIDRIKADLIEADGRIDSLKSMLLKARRMERGGVDDPGPSVWRTGDPLDMAKMLDNLMVAMRPSSTDAGFAGESAAALEVPDGIRPDQADAIRWMLHQERPVTLVVDGYNVSFQLDESRFSTPELRDQVREGLTRLRRLAKGPLPVVLVFDSSAEEATFPGPIETRFVRSADDEIVRLAAGLPGDVIVVSTDREVRERAELNGAIALWSDALVAWMRNR